MPRFEPADLAALFQAACARGLSTVLDVVVPAGASVPVALLEPVLPHTCFFLPNEDEARVMTGCADPRAQAEKLGSLAAGCSIVITRGSLGCSAWRAGEWLEIPAFHVESVDESGAGDAFAAGLIAGILQDWPLDRMLRFAAAVGASCTRALGCTEGVFTMDEALDFLEAGCL
jgi:sugar/nucleoside kinase (ribokinase family)